MRGFDRLFSIPYTSGHALGHSIAPLRDPTRFDAASIPRRVTLVADGAFGVIAAPCRFADAPHGTQRPKRFRTGVFIPDSNRHRFQNLTACSERVIRL